MKTFTRITSGVAVQPLLAELRDAPHLWDSRPERRTEPGSPHTQMRDIWLRYNDPKKIGSPEFHSPHVPINYPAWYALPSAQRIAHDLMAMVDGEMLGGVLITKIPSGGRIAPHVDRGWHVDYYSKFYVSLRSRPGANFYAEEPDGGVSYINPAPGEVYLFDNRGTHWVENLSPDDRITLIVCIHTEKPGYCAPLHVASLRSPTGA